MDTIKYKVGDYLVDTFNPYIVKDIEKCKCEILEVITTNHPVQPHSLFMRFRKWPVVKDPENGNDTNPIEACHYIPVDKFFLEQYKPESEVDMSQIKEYERLSKQMLSKQDKPLKYKW